MRTTNERLSLDLENYKKLLLKQGKPAVVQPKQNQLPVNQTVIVAKCSQDFAVSRDEIVQPKKTYKEDCSQISLLSPQMIQDRDVQILYQQNEIEEKQRKVDELEKQLQTIQAVKAVVVNESETMKTLRFDHSILMKRVKDYKKAEQNAKEMVNDYEQMKLKYFNVLTETSKQKLSTQGLIQSKLDSEIQLKELNEEK